MTIEWNDIVSGMTHYPMMVDGEVVTQWKQPEPPECECESCLSMHIKEQWPRCAKCGKSLFVHFWIEPCECCYAGELG